MLLSRRCNLTTPLTAREGPISRCERRLRRNAAGRGGGTSRSSRPGYGLIIEPMRRNSSSTVVVLAGSAPGEVFAALGRSMNVTLIRPEDPAGKDGIEAAAAGLER